MKAVPKQVGAFSSDYQSVDVIAKRTIQTNVNFPIWNQGLDYGELLVEIHRQDIIQKNKKKSRGRKDYNFPLTVKTANKARFIALCIQGTSDVSSFATIQLAVLLKRIDSNPLDSNHQHSCKTLNLVGLHNHLKIEFVGYVAQLNLVGSLWLYNLWHHPSQNVTQHTILVLQYKPIRRLNSAGLLYRLLGGIIPLNL